MRIQEVTWQNRNDYSAVMVCEHCSETAEDKRGYNDENYHVNVIPKMICPACRKNRAGEVSP